MIIERWGAFSVIDHNNIALLVPEILLYDKIIFPYPTDKKERKRWEDKDWNPEKLDDILNLLGDIAIKKPWDEHRRKVWSKKLDEYKGIQADADGYSTTRQVIAQETPKTPEGVDKVKVIPAYQSYSDFKKDFRMDKITDEKSNLAFLVRQELAVPNDKDPNKALEIAIELVRSNDFKKKRRDLYRWQHEMIAEKIEPKKAMQDMNNMLEGYNNSVKEASREASREVKKSFVYDVIIPIAEIGATLAGGVIDFPTIGLGGLSIIQFLRNDRKPVINAGENKPAAVFHDWQKIL